MNAPDRLRASFAWSLAAVMTCLLVAAVPAQAAPPQPCGGVPQITDVQGDGHHTSSDVLAAWFSEESGHLQAVIKVRSGTWEPEHEDAEENGSGFAMLFSVGGHLEYVRARAWLHNEKPISFDYGTFAQGSWFTSVGTTTGSVEYATYGGSVTIDVPETTGAVPGAKLSGPFVLTYDGITGGLPDWVDQAPGGTSPGDTARGADYIVGSCLGGGAAGDHTVAVRLAAPRARRGRGRVRVKGSVVPAREGVPVELTVSGKGGKPRTLRITSGAGGEFATTIAVAEVTRLRAEAESIASETLTVDVRSTVQIQARRLRSGRFLVRGHIDPGLPGRLLLLPVDEVEPVASKTAKGPRFAFSLKPGRLPPGGYQVVYIPARGRAERATSNTIAVARRRAPTHMLRACRFATIGACGR